MLSPAGSEDRAGKDRPRDKGGERLWVQTCQVSENLAGLSSHAVLSEPLGLMYH